MFLRTLNMPPIEGAVDVGVWVDCKCMESVAADWCTVKWLRLDQTIITGVSFRKILGFYQKQNRQFFYYDGTSSYIPLKIPERVNRVIFQNSSELLLLKIPKQTKSTTKAALALLQECYLGVFIISLENTFLENIYINRSEEETERQRERDRETERQRQRESERVNGGVSFQLQAVTSLFLVKLQVFTINSSEEFFDRVYNGMCLYLQNMKNLAFTFTFLLSFRPLLQITALLVQLPHETV